jgi:rhamnosyltransferase
MVQTICFDLFIIDSSSSDGTREFAEVHATKVYTIPAAEFNHGGTRQRVMDLNLDYDVYIYLTQDAYLFDSDSLNNIIQPFKDDKVGAVCGRQLPHFNSTLFAKHLRYYNYPKYTYLTSLFDVSKKGIKAAFMSNSFAAYRSKALKSVGGFPDHIILGEDMYVAAKMLLSGWKLAYSGNAKCYHSHNYTIVQEFQRYFDMGVFHSREPWLHQNFGGVKGEGIKFVVSELIFLGLRYFYLWPNSLFRNSVKLLGYKLGCYEYYLPIVTKRWLSMHKRYWDSSFATAYSKNYGI